MMILGLVWILFCLCSQGYSFLLPHKAERPLYPTYWRRRGNTRPGCLNLQLCIDKLKTYHVVNNDLTLLSDGLRRPVIRSLLPHNVRWFNNSNSLYQLYSITNGVVYEDNEHELQSLWLIPNYMLLNLEDAIELYTNFPREKLLSLTRDEYFYVGGTSYDHTSELLKIELQSSWFPIMSSGMGAYIFLNLEDGDIFEYSPFEDLQNTQSGLIYHDNILQLFQAIVRDFDNGIYGINGKNIVVDESDLSMDIVSQLDRKRFWDLNKDLEDTESTDYDTSNHREKRSRLKTIIEGIQLHTDKHLRKLFNRFGIPLLHLSCHYMEAICDYIQSDIQQNHAHRNLCKITDRTEVRMISRNVCGKIKMKRGWDCSSYPFLTTRQSDEYVAPGVLVPTDQNIIHGGQLSLFYEATRRDAAHYRNSCFKLTNF